jgi:hypothetical protein
MLTIWGGRRDSNCEGFGRRDFLKVGAVSAAGLSLGGLLSAQAKAGRDGRSMPGGKSVVWLWLGGGPTHIETFDPKMDAPLEFRSAVGAVDTVIPGVQFGGVYPKLAALADRMAVVRSFAHQNSGHAGGTHWVMTGYDYPPADQGMEPIKPSLGSIVTRVRGSNHPKTGIPTYVRLSGIYGDGPAWLGAANAPFDTGGDARNNMNLSIAQDRVGDRRGLLSELDRLHRTVDQSGLMEGLDEFEGQAFQLILGRAKEAFDLNREDPRVRERYGQGLGEQMLMARRLCEAGCGFVTIHYGGWDMHGGIEGAMRSTAPPMDQAVAAFIDDTVQRGLNEDILLVITGEFGRTPRINGGAGRDHWAPLTTLALAGGGLRMGQVIGESSPKAEVPQNRAIDPQDLMATVFEVMGLNRELAYIDPAGRPTPMITSGRVIAELV